MAIRKIDEKMINAELAQYVDAPVTATSTGLVGEWSVDESYLYVCVAVDTWKRVALAAW